MKFPDTGSSLLVYSFGAVVLEWNVEMESALLNMDCNYVSVCSAIFWKEKAVSLAVSVKLYLSSNAKKYVSIHL